jgi:hypothetical protein
MSNVRRRGSCFYTILDLPVWRRLEEEAKGYYPNVGFRIIMKVKE